MTATERLLNPLNTPPPEVFLHVLLSVIPAHLNAFIGATVVNRTSTRLEPGCKRFDIMQKQDNPCLFILVEVYENAEARQLHRKREHVITWKAAVKALLTEDINATIVDAIVSPKLLSGFSRVGRTALISTATPEHAMTFVVRAADAAIVRHISGFSSADQAATAHLMQHVARARPPLPPATPSEPNPLTVFSHVTPDVLWRSMAAPFLTKFGQDLNVT